MEKERVNVNFGGLSTILHIFTVPIFTFLFMVIYHPFEVNEHLEIGGLPFLANIAICVAIIFGVLVLTRSLLYFLGGKISNSNILYVAWCLGEIVVSSQFISLYITLMLGDNTSFFAISGRILGLMLSINIYPYTFLLISLDYYEKFKDSQNAPQANREQLVRFHDEYHKLKFIIAAPAIVYVQSEENYVQVYYLDQQKMKKEILRSSLRALEDTLSKHGLVRCHRSYIINPEYIQMLRKDGNGALVAELNRDGCSAIPVSRKYQDAITRLL